MSYISLDSNNKIFSVADLEDAQLNWGTNNSIVSQVRPPVYSNTINTQLEDTKTYPIKGNMLEVLYEIDKVAATRGGITNEGIKKILCKLLVEEIYNKNMISFMMHDDIQDDTRRFVARIFVTEKDDTQLLQEWRKNHEPRR